MSLVECSVCKEVQYRPRVLWCGHSFCESCSLNVINTKKPCPYCNQVPENYPEFNTLIHNYALDAIAEKERPEEYKERSQKVTVQQWLASYGRLRDKITLIVTGKVDHKDLIQLIQKLEAKGLFDITTCDSGESILGTVDKKEMHAMAFGKIGRVVSWCCKASTIFTIRWSDYGLTIWF